jgi:hypothetical protein
MFKKEKLEQFLIKLENIKSYNCKEARTFYKEFNNIRRALGHKQFWLKTKIYTVSDKIILRQRWPEYYEMNSEWKDATVDSTKERGRECLQTAKPYVEQPSHTGTEIAVNKLKNNMYCSDKM